MLFRARRLPSVRCIASRSELSIARDLRQNGVMNRRILLASLGTLLVQFQASNAQTPKRGPVFQHDLPDLNLRGWSVTTVEVDYEPGGSSKAHRHPGLTFAYVLEGEIASKVGDEPEKTYATGEMWMETPNQLHAVSRNASATKPARLLAILLAEKGKPLTTPA
jgi:quercetin dioxygenase-like cupin family protein